MFPARALAFAIALGAILSPAHAVLVAGGDGTQNTTAPVADDFGFANVGRVFSTTDNVFVSGVYLGNGWVLSAYHGVRNPSGNGFSFGDVFFSGVPYAVDSGSAVRLTTPGSGSADLALFRISGTPPELPAVSLSGTTPVVASTLALAGNGRNRAAEETHWDVATATNPDTWTTTNGAGDEQGYYYGPGATLRWGMNTRSMDLLTNATSPFGTTRVYRTNFNDAPFGLADEAQAAPGDSGGGVFYKNGSNWELAGIMIATSAPLDGQPPETAVYSNQTFVADVAAYREQIVATIPEPSAGMILCAGFPLALAFRRFR